MTLVVKHSSSPPLTMAEHYHPADVDWFNQGHLFVRKRHQTLVGSTVYHTVLQWVFGSAHARGISILTMAKRKAMFENQWLSKYRYRLTLEKGRNMCVE